MIWDLRLVGIMRLVLRCIFLDEEWDSKKLDVGRSKTLNCQYWAE